MFGTSGIRGIYGKDVTEDLAVKIGNVFADSELFIARDLRSSGIPLSLAVSAGALCAGSDVIDVGIAPTPTLALAAKKSRGIMVTASHNPPEYNGLKLVENGKEIGKKLEKEVQEKFSGPLRKGDVGDFSHDNECVGAHKDLILSMVDVDAVRAKAPRVIADCNGAAAVITPYLLSELGCRVVSVNSSLECFNRPSEPNGDNLKHLRALVRESGADFGVGHDGDGDRCVIIDEKGEILPFDVQLAMMIEHELSLSSNRRIVSTVEASLTIRDVVEKAGGEIEITPVGSTHVGEAIEKNNALFGGEPCGEYVYQKGVHVPDAPMAVAKFAEIFCTNGKFSELRKNYKQNFISRKKFPSEDKRKAVEEIRKNIDIEGKVRDDDGIRVDEEDGWFLIRASGTEPIVRLTMEYSTKEKLAEREKKLLDLIKNHC
jgi:phosphomannomutase/phosphoglucomutase